MTPRINGAITAALTLGLAVPLSAQATNGYFSHGWGTQSKAMAGVAAALPQDPLVAATNPAGMAFVGNEFQLGLAFFSPSPRGYTAHNDYSTSGGFPTGPFVSPGKYDSSSDWFLIPSLGYNYQIDNQSTIGVAIYGNGGMNTDYRARPPFENFAAYPNQLAVSPGTQPPQESGQFASPSGLLFRMTPQGPMPVTGPVHAPNNANPNGVFTASTPTGISLNQLFIEIPYTYKLAGGKQSIGIAPVFAVQTFQAKGLQPFRQLSVQPDNVTNNGIDYSYGAGLHFGWYGQVNDRLAFGASYRTTVWMTKFSEYAGLFANGGSFNIPAMLELGVAYKALPNLTVAFDYQRIFYGDIASISNSNDMDLSQCQGRVLKPSYCLGGESGVGFGWESMDVLKLGLKYDVSDRLSLMAGVSYNSDFLKTDKQALFNVLSPGTIRWHLTLGGSYRVGERDALNLAFAYMPKAAVDGTSPSLTETQTGTIYMQQMEIELSWTHNF